MNQQAKSYENTGEPLWKAELRGGDAGSYNFWKNPDKRPYSRFWSKLVLSIGLFLLSIAILAIITNGGIGPSFTTGPSKSSISCGEPGKEARQSGCLYDFISGAWVHPECHDTELEEEFLALQDWEWFEDDAKVRQVPVEEMRRTGGPNPVYVSIKYHDTHCAYTWKKLHRAILGKRKIDSQIGSIHHTMHCSDTIFRNRSEDQAISRFGHKSTFCLDPMEESNPDGKL